MSPDVILPQDKGERTVLQALLRRVESDADSIYGSFPWSDDIEDGFRDFTIGELARVVDACAWLIKARYGISVDFETLLFMGDNDFCYTIVTFAAMKCGYKACFLNPGNPILDNISILEQVDCTKALHNEHTKELVERYKTHRPQLQVLEIPTLHQFFFELQAQAQQPFPYQTRPYQESKHDPILVLHSSGTTGNPKPIIVRNGYVQGLDTRWSGGGGQMELFDNLHGGFYYGPFAAFHAGSFLTMTVMPTMSRCALLMAPAIPSAARDGMLALRMIEKRNVRMLIASPGLLESICRVAGGAERLVALECVGFGSGPLRSALGNELSSKGVRLVNIYGSSEACWIPTRNSGEMEDWEWLDFHPDLKIDWRDSGYGDGTHELCYAEEKPEVEELRGTHWTAQPRDWRSKDLFVQHATKAGLWRLTGRKDDMLILASGGKINPVPLEDIVSSDDLVAGTLVAGQNRWPPCMLIEPKEPVDDVGSFIACIKPRVEVANGLVREDCRVPSRNVIVVEPGSFVRNFKGGVVRARTVKHFERLIEGVYTHAGG